MSVTPKYPRVQVTFSGDIRRANCDVSLRAPHCELMKPLNPQPVITGEEVVPDFIKQGKVSW
jgi:hypothetical protein